MKDTIYKTDQLPSRFQFDAKVATVFDDMIRRSVPGYDEIIRGSIDLCQAQKHSGALRIYDLGCATGETALTLLSHVSNPVELVAVDCSEPMLNKAETLINQFEFDAHNVEFLLQDILNTNINQADVILLLFTLQFIDPADRQTLLKNIYDGLCPGGVLIIAEKTHHPHLKTQTLLDAMHLDYKRQQHYSELEISQKRQALDNVLITETLEAHIRRLECCGFSNPFCWYYNRLFAAMACYK